MVEGASISEVSVRALNRATSRVIERASEGERIIVTRNGQPVAVILSVHDATDWLVASADEFVPLRMAARQEVDQQ